MQNYQKIWITPCLFILARARDQESLLTTTCKIGSSGAQFADYSGCSTIGGACEALPSP